MTDGIKKSIDYIKTNDSYIEKAMSLQKSVWCGDKINIPPLALSCWLTEEQSSWITWHNTKEIHFDVVQ